MSHPYGVDRIDTQDIVEQNEADDLWEVILRQMSPGPFHGQVEYIQLNGLIFYREHWNQRVLATGATPGGFFTFGASLLPGKTVDWCGGMANRQHLAYGRPRSEMEIASPDESHHVALLVPPHLLQHYFDEELIANALSSHLHHLRCNPEPGRDLITILDHMISKYQANGALLDDARERKAAESQLMNSLAECFADFYTDAYHATPSQRRKTLHRAIEFSESIRAPITVPEYAAATGMSQRSLELAFKETLDITPRRYLRWHRLHSVHCDLLASDAGSVTVTQVASHWGFNELGRFAVEYRQLFGESPSTTIKQRKTSPQKRLSDALPG